MIAIYGNLLLLGVVTWLFVATTNLGRKIEADEPQPAICDEPAA